MADNEPRPPTPWELMVFVTVAEAQQATHAGRLLAQRRGGVVVGRQNVELAIRRLNSWAGEPLFVRTRIGAWRALVLTDKGKWLLPYAQAIVKLYDEIGRHAHGR